MHVCTNYFLFDIQKHFSSLNATISGSAFNGNCVVNEQCYSVVGAVCRAENSAKPNAKKCSCPEGPYTHEYGQCLRSKRNYDSLGVSS